MSESFTSFDVLLIGSAILMAVGLMWATARLVSHPLVRGRKEWELAQRRLGIDANNQIDKAVFWGRAVDDRGLATMAKDAATRNKLHARQLSLLFLLNTVIFSFFARNSRRLPFLWGSASVVCFLFACVVFWSFLMARRAERRNAELAGERSGVAGGDSKSARDAGE